MKELQDILDQYITNGANFATSTEIVTINDRSKRVEVIEYQRPQGGKGSYHDAIVDFTDVYNNAAIQAAKKSIEAKIASEKEAERIREEQRIAAEAEAEKLRKEAEEALKAEHVKALEAERAKLAEYENARNSKKNKATKWVMVVALVFMFMASGVTMFLNIHNLEMLFGKILPIAVLVVFALFLSFVPIIYAWFKNKMKVEAATIIGPVDIVVAVILFYLLNDASFLYNVEWVTSNKEIIQLTVSFIGSIFYAYQLYMTFNELYAILSDKKYEEFFNKLFE